jgi:serine phosphatase RsbU (regulator of sigma subunit)
LQRHAGHDPPAVGRRDEPRRLLWPAAAAVLVGLLITGTLTWVSRSQYLDTEHRLLTLRARDAGALITTAVPGIQTTLASAAELADSSGGNVAKFERFIAPSVGAGPGRPFISASLWRLGDVRRGPVAVSGVTPELASSPSRAAAFFAAATRRPALSVIGLLGAPSPRLGYGIDTVGRGGGFAVYGESPLPANRRSRLAKSSQFAGLDYAVFLGATPRPGQLLVTSRRRLPLPGVTSAVTVAFGNTALTLVMSTQGSLAGELPRDLPWIIAIFGILLSFAAAGTIQRLARGRLAAEQLAERLEASATENRRLYAEQRTIAQTLQHALLPEQLPQIAGVRSTAIYQPGERGVDIGGDWYDVLDLGGRRLLMVVGDVSGRGLRAATTMATLRYAIHAYARQQDAPGAILTKLSNLMSVSDTGQIATILCALVDRERGVVTLANAGHLPPLLIAGADAQYLPSTVGVPIGVEAGAAYDEVTLPTPTAATLIAYTDGLVERRGETLDQGLARLRDRAAGRNIALRELLGVLVTEVAHGRSDDDIAIVALQWTS